MGTWLADLGEDTNIPSLLCRQAADTVGWLVHERLQVRTQAYCLRGSGATDGGSR